MPEGVAIDILETKRHRAQAKDDNTAQYRGQDRQADGDQRNGEKAIAAVQKINDQGCAGQRCADTGPVQKVKALQAFEHASEDAERKAEADRSADHEQQEAGLLMPFPRKFKKTRPRTTWP